jgi:hypothetical protein
MPPKKKPKKPEKKLTVEDFKRLREALGTELLDKKIKSMTKAEQKDIEKIFVKKKSR